MRLSVVLLALGSLCGNASIAQTTFCVEVPPTTPSSATLYLAGSFNNWEPGSTAHRFTRSPDGTYQLTLPASVWGNVAYKITRGSWVTAETDGQYQDISNRSHTIPAPGGRPTRIRVQVVAWKDQGPGGVSASCLSTALRPNVQLISTDFSLPQLKRTRRIWIYLPTSYTANHAQRYPVLYMHDGQNVFDACTSFSGEWGVDETLNQLQQQGLDATGCIVVAVDNGGTERLNELSPWKNPEYGGGQGAAYVGFMVQTLKPYIDAHYRTLTGREFTGIAGSSMGGLISTYAALKYPQVYSKVGVFSPAYWFAKDSLFRYVQQQRPRPGTKFYFVSGTTESETMVPLMKAMQDTLAQTGAEVQLTIPADGKHAEWFWQREFPAAYRWLYGPASTRYQGKKREPLAHSTYLNPEQTHLQVHLPAGCDRGRIAVINQEKQRVLRQQVKGDDSVDISRLPAGSYEVLVRVGERQGSQWLVKQ